MPFPFLLRREIGREPPCGEVCLGVCMDDYDADPVFHDALLDLDERTQIEFDLWNESAV